MPKIITAACINSKPDADCWSAIDANIGVKARRKASEIPNMIVEIYIGDPSLHTHERP